MIILLIYAALFIPFKISFVDDGEYPTWDIIDYIVDAFFSLDILINFISAYYDD